MRDEELYLQDILEAIDDIGKFTAGYDRESFLNNKQVQFAVVFALIMKGEAANHLSKDLRDRYSEVPWLDMIDQRNVIAHGYFALQWEDVWYTATRDVPPLRPHIRQIIDIEFRQDGDSEHHHNDHASQHRDSSRRAGQVVPALSCP